MSFLARATRPAQRTAIHLFKPNAFATRAAMSTISEAIKKDHQEIKEYANNIRAATDDDTKTRWQNQFTWELARHSIGEELVVYPAFEKHLGAKGQEMADKDRAEHQSVSILLTPFHLIQIKMKHKYNFCPVLFHEKRNQLSDNTNHRSKKPSRNSKTSPPPPPNSCPPSNP
jgi:hypothetical protein